MATRSVWAIGVLSFCLLTAHGARAANQDAVLQKVTALNRTAVAAFGELNFAKMRKDLEQAAQAGKDVLGTHKMMARTYLNLGVLWAAGYNNRGKAVGFFARALKINPDIAVTGPMVSPNVTAAFEAARAPAAETAPQEAQAPSAAPEPQESEKPVTKVSAAARKQADQARVEIGNLQAELNQIKQQLRQTQQENTENQRLLADANRRLTRQSETRERLETQAQEMQRFVADAKDRLQQIDRERSAKDRQVADALAREKTEREAREKFERNMTDLQARDKERKATLDKEKVDREKLAAGPDVPARIPEPLFCALPDEAQAGTDLYVHCVTQPGIKAKEIAFYYRPSGVSVFSAIVMDPSKKGWSTAVIPGRKISGKTLQYYTEARDAHQSVAATTGKASSPNILVVRPAQK